MDDKQFHAMLLHLDKTIEASKGEMAASGVVSECADCAVTGEGTCCSARTGHKSDSILLLVNLLLNNPLPEKEHNADLCYFLTGSGCSLRARPVICVNFVCGRIRENIPFQTLIHLQKTIGDELDTLFAIEEYVKKKLLKTKTIRE
jgi:hypothetical protein